MTATRTPEWARGHLDALERIAEEGATNGWDRVPALLETLGQLAASDLRDQLDRAGTARPLDDHRIGWAAAVHHAITAAVDMSPDAFAPWLRRAVLAAALAMGDLISPDGP